MIPFVLGVITGFLFGVFLLVLYAVVRASGEANRKEEKWEKKDED